MALYRYIRAVFGSTLIVPYGNGGKFDDPFISFLKVMFKVSPSVTVYDTLVNPCTVGNGIRVNIIQSIMCMYIIQHTNAL